MFSIRQLLTVNLNDISNIVDEKVWQLSREYLFGEKTYLKEGKCMKITKPIAYLSVTKLFTNYSPILGRVKVKDPLNLVHTL